MIDIIVDHWAIASLVDSSEWFQDGDIVCVAQARDPGMTQAEYEAYLTLPTSARVSILRGLHEVAIASSERLCRFIVTDVPIDSLEDFGLQNDGDRFVSDQVDPEPVPHPDPDNPHSRFSVWGVTDSDLIRAGELYDRTWDEYKTIVFNRQGDFPLQDQYLAVNRAPGSFGARVYG